MAPDSEKYYPVSCQNGYEGILCRPTPWASPHVSMPTATCRSWTARRWPRRARSSTTCCATTCWSRPRRRPSWGRSTDGRWGPGNWKPGILKTWSGLQDARIAGSQVFTPSPVHDDRDAGSLSQFGQEPSIHSRGKLLLAAFLLSAPLAQAAVILQSDTHQITSSLSRETTPSLSADNISPLVVYTSSESLGTGVFFCWHNRGLRFSF